MANVEAVTRQVALVITFLALAGLAFAAAAGTVVVSAALRPLNRVAGTAMTVSRLPLDRGDVDISARVPGEYTDTETEVGKVGSALNTMLGHVESALAARQRSEDKVRRFVADASHELRTPLASIRGYSELTRRTQKDLPDEVTRSLGRIESEAVRMTSLVEDLLLLARLDSQPELRRDEVDVSLMVVEAVGDAHAAGPEHVWSVDIPEEPVAVLGDDPRLRQVIVNLLANARTHTPPGTEIEASVAQEGDEVLLRVHDNGPGIDPSIADTLFERFTRADTSRARTTGSTGLGLSIVSAVAQAHGGTVSVESVPGDTTFTVRLPAVVSSALSDDAPEASEDDELHDSAAMTVEAAEAEPTAAADRPSSPR
jgi:two-component system OmpR family sensor kinase